MRYVFPPNLSKMTDEVFCAVEPDVMATAQELIRLMAEHHQKPERMVGSAVSAYVSSQTEWQVLIPPGYKLVKITDEGNSQQENTDGEQFMDADTTSKI